MDYLFCNNIHEMMTISTFDFQELPRKLIYIEVERGIAMAGLIVSHTRFNVIRPPIVIYTFKSCVFDLHKMDIFSCVWASVYVVGKMCRTSHVLHDTTRTSYANVDELCCWLQYAVWICYERFLHRGWKMQRRYTTVHCSMNSSSNKLY